MPKEKLNAETHGLSKDGYKKFIFLFIIK